ncbi:MAG: alpha/beta hydrolase [Actinomycetota bacterium]|nr:alpha/beta hydrolase [Actinomycetota bacterium]
MRDTAPDLDLGDGLVARHVPGPGERVLWIHGYTMDSSIWRELWGLLPAWDHLGLDLPGHGASRPIHDAEDLPALAGRVGELALRHGVRHVCALSFGTMLAVEMAIRHPGAFDTVVLAAPALAGGPQDAAVAQRYRELALLYRQKGSGPHMAELWMRSPPHTFKGIDARPQVREHMERLATRHPWRELEGLAMLRLTNPPQTEDQVRTISSEVLVLVGEDDMPAFRQCADMIAGWVPSGRRVDLAGLGHLCCLEAPEIAAPLIHDHLAMERPFDGGYETGRTR